MLYKKETIYKMDLEKNKQDRLKGILATIGFHLILLVSFLFFGLRTPLPLPEEEGVEIILGTMDGMDDEMFIPPPRHIPATPTPLPREAEEEIVTQDTDEAPAIDRAERPRRTEEPPRPETTQEPREIAEDRKPEPVVDDRYVFPGSSRTGGQQGQTERPGYQGSPNGTPDGHADGGGSGGVSFSLTGRNSRSLPLPSYDSPEQGIVVVTIHVDRNGRVVRAVPGARGTTTTNQTLRNQARAAALRATFDANPNAPEEQIGTITYRFLRVQ